jgi:hypothetical protein
MGAGEGFAKRVVAAFSEGGGFAADMKAAGIHVGMGRDPRCVNCGEAWPCAGSRNPAPLAAPVVGGKE